MGKKNKNSKKNDEMDEFLDKLEKQMKEIRKQKMTKQQRERYKSFLQTYTRDTQNQAKTKDKVSNQSKNSANKPPVPVQKKWVK